MDSQDVDERWNLSLIYFQKIALSFEDVGTSGPLKRGEITELPLLRLLFWNSTTM